MPHSLDDLPEEYFRSHQPPRHINDVLREVLYTNPNARHNFLEARIRTLWRKHNPPHISSLTGHISLNGGTLRIEIKNAGLRANLALQRDAVRDKLNELLGEKIVFNLIFF